MMSKIRKSIIVAMVLLAFTFILPMAGEGKQVQGAALNYTGLSLSQGGSYTLKVTGTSSKVKWSSSNEKIATVKNGKVSAYEAGKCIVTAKVGGKKYTCKITVIEDPNYIPKKADFKDVTLNLSTLKLDVSKVTYSKKGKAKRSNLKGTYTLKLLNTKKTPKWKSSNKKVATVKKGKITAVSKGKCTIKAVIGKKSYKCKVVVTNYKNANKISCQENIYNMLGLVNVDRVKAKAAPLKINEKLNKMADIRAKEAKNKFSHTRPDGTSYKTVYNDVGFKIGRTVGENLAYTSDHVEYMDNFVNEAYKGLYASEGHRRNMLDKKFEYIGIGYAEIDTYFNDLGILCAGTYWSQEFYTK